MTTHPRKLSLSLISEPLVLLIIGVLAYGLLIPQLGFYWDDLLSVWIRYQLGPEATARCFAMGRPVLGAFFQLTTSLIPPVPLYWHIFALFWRLSLTVCLWALVRHLWPQARGFSLGVSLLFLVYPGFNQQFVAYVYGHYFVVFTFFLLSLLCTLWSLRFVKWYWPVTILGMLLAAANLWMLEYFFLLELLRPMIIWLALRNTVPERNARLRRLFRLWAPYLIVFLLAALWRLFVFQNRLYPYSFFDDFKAQPVETLITLLKVIFSSLFLATAIAWTQVFHFPDPLLWDSGVISAYVMVVLITCLILIAHFFLSRWRSHSDKNIDYHHSRWALTLGLIALLVSGWPFWLVDFPIHLGFPSNRFTLPFMLGVSLLLAGLMEFLPRQGLRFTILAILVGLAVGRHYLWAQEYRHEWETQKNLFWQMAWRVPAIEPGTLFLMNDSALRYYADNSLSAPLNWIYDPENHTTDITYLLMHPRSRLGGSLPALEIDRPIRYNFFAGQFVGNTSRTVVMYFRPPGCLRVLDPEIDARNPFLPDLIRQAVPLSRSELILTEGSPSLPGLYQPQPSFGWCEYFEKADLARQQGDWPQVASLGEEALSAGYHPYDPMERFVFIEGFAHIGNWNRASRLSLQSYRYYPSQVGPLLCILWDRIIAGTPDTPDRRSVVPDLMQRIGCPGNP